MELLKEEQNRIFERQMRDLMLRANLKGTYNVARLQQQAREQTQPEAEVQQDDGRHSAQVQADLQERARQLQTRQQQTGEAHQQALSRFSPIPMIRNIFGGEQPDLQRTSSAPVRAISSSSGSSSSSSKSRSPAQTDEELIPDEEMLTAREEKISPHQEKVY